MEENKQLDDFVKKSINEVGLENPSIDFTNVVMSKIKVETERSTVFIHQPLFSKPTWFVIISIIVAVFAYVIFGQPAEEGTGLLFSRLNELTVFNFMGKIPNISVPNTLFYGVLAVIFFVWIQILFLKNRFDKAYSFN